MDQGGRVRCGRCGTENSEVNRFCGMCGAILIKKMQSPAAGAVSAPAGGAAKKDSETSAVRQPVERISPASAVRPASATLPETDRRGAPPENANATITGPSFLGLNKPGNGQSGDLRGSFYEHTRARDSRSDDLDYLLEDEEEPKRGWGIFVAIVLALALAGGFGYLRWRQGGFDWLLNDRKPGPGATVPSQNPTDSAGSPGSGDISAAANSNTATNSSAANPVAPVSATPAPASPEAAPGGTSAPAPATATDGSTATASQNAGTAGSNSTPAGGAAQNAAPTVPSQDSSAASPAENHADNLESKPATKPGESRATDDDTTTNSEAVPDNSKPDAASRIKTRKPSPVIPLDPTSEADRYIYGRGVQQDCDRGLRLLKPAAAQANLKAMTTLGELYSSGTCTPRDLPTAYRWYALALRKQPESQSLQDNLQKLWSQMTPPERQLAIKLSQ